MPVALSAHIMHHSATRHVVVTVHRAVPWVRRVVKRPMTPRWLVPWVRALRDALAGAHAAERAAAATAVAAAVTTLPDSVAAIIGQYAEDTPPRLTLTGRGDLACRPEFELRTDLSLAGVFQALRVAGTTVVCVKSVVGYGMHW